MIIFGVLLGMLMVWAKIFRFGIRLPIYQELSLFTSPPPVPLFLEPSWEQFGNFSSSDQCLKSSFSTSVNYSAKEPIDMNATPRKPREKNATPRKPHEKKKFEGGSNDAATNDDSGGAKKRWHGKHNRAKAKKAKGDEGLPPLSQQESVALKPGKPRPNAFLALRLSNPEIHSNVRRFQEKFLADNPKLGRFCVPVQKSHVSLQVNMCSSRWRCSTFHAAGHTAEAGGADRLESRSRRFPREARSDSTG